MKKGTIRTLTITLLLVALLGSTVYAASYKIGPYPHTSRYVYMQDLYGDSYYNQRLNNAMGYWNSSSAHVGIWQSYSYSNDQFTVIYDSSTTAEGISYAWNPGDGTNAYYVQMNATAINNDNARNENCYVEGAIVHEIGHVYGLLDLSWYDDHSQIMSYYNDRYVRYIPQSGDIAGVNSIYQ